MSRGKKLDLQIGAEFDEGWAQVTEKRASVIVESLEPSRHQLVFHKEKRRGKPVTLVGPFSVSKDEMKELLKTLKKRLGCGGTVNEVFLEFQGDIQTKLKGLLEEMEYRFKRR
ncbi:translation initiation factor [Sulfurimonas sp. HSL3-7]|uniref:translation initiation factor n=1 Tax=Sulfonitrofixus jiaomeiensis TaxID=3131938 RepID=UPI0031F8AAE7